MSTLFTPYRLRGVETRNRVWVAPMCQYSCDGDGVATDWHLVHLGSRAVGGAGLVMTEAAAVTEDGRITWWDLGIWNDAQGDALAPITKFIESQGAVPAIQLAHAGRKASTNRPWGGGKPIAETDAEGWQVRGPSAIAFNEGYPEPNAYTTEEVHGIIVSFADAAARSVRAGFRAIEVHSAHGYLLHQFLSPHTNTREDEFGGSFAGRTRLTVEVARAVRAAIPETMPLLVRISSSEYVDEGWDLEQSIALATLLKDVGVDLIDCSSGGNLPHQNLTFYPGYQVPFAHAIREQAGIPTGAVGLITEPSHAEGVVAGDDADVVLLAREELRDPYWPMRAAKALGADHDWPVQYQRAK